MKTRNLICAVLLLFTAPVFSLMTAPQDFIVGTQAADWSQNLNVVNFDTSLGQLTGVIISINSNMDCDLTIKNVSSKKGSSGTATAGVTFTISDGDTLNNGLTLTPTAFGYTLLANASTLTGDMTAIGGQTFSLNNLTILNKFSAPGTTALSLTTLTETQLMNTGGNTFIDEDSIFNAGATVSISYQYIPEPVTITLLSIGALTVLRKRNK